LWKLRGKKLHKTQGHESKSIIMRDMDEEEKRGKEDKKE
jgi:hypothetical protein